jgi:hypothetical protein
MTNPAGYLFDVGQLMTTRGALAAAEQIAWQMPQLFGDEDVTDDLRAHLLLFVLVERHRRGDWGALPPEDAKANDVAVQWRQDRILSAYPFGPIRFWVITEHDRSHSTILLPEEY